MPHPPEPRADQQSDAWSAPSSSPPADVRGAHGLGPHVVGQRVVVRRVLPGQTGPSGGPALTDLLGVCLAWADGTCVVQPETGPPVSIATRDIVSGKPVPPRPPTRTRVEPDAAQRRAARLFPGLQTAPLGGWQLRYSADHPARRARSALALQPAGLDPDTAYAGVLDFYAGHGARPIAAVLPDSDPERLFLARGWVPESGDAETVFALGGLASVRRRLPRAGASGLGSGRAEVELLEQGDLATVRLGEPDAPLAGGVAVVDRDWAGLRSLYVDPAHRRRGLGLAVLAALLEWCAERGATTAYLQVLADNAPALGLYERIGFVEHHRYRYLAAPLEPREVPGED